MSKFSEQLQKEAYSIQLTKREKDVMRARLMEAMGEGAAPSPYFFFSFQFAHSARYALAAVMLFAVVGGGTVSAASAALPGDALYPVKIAVNERVELALATTPEEKIETEVRFAERRIAEAQALDEKERLDTETSEELEREFDRHVGNALALAESVAQEEESEEELFSAVRFERADFSAQEEEDAAAGASQEEGEPPVEASATMMLKVTEDEVPQEEAVAEDTATTTATTTKKVWSREDFFLSLDERRNTFRELRERAERRERGEVRGTFIKADDEDEKKDKSDDEDEEEREDKDNEREEDDSNKDAEKPLDLKVEI